MYFILVETNADVSHHKWLKKVQRQTSSDAQITINLKCVRVNGTHTNIRTQLSIHLIRPAFLKSLSIYIT